GEYVSYGIRVPEVRSVTRRFRGHEAPARVRRLPARRDIRKTVDRNCRHDYRECHGTKRSPSRRGNEHAHNSPIDDRGACSPTVRIRRCTPQTSWSLRRHVRKVTAQAALTALTSFGQACL